mmetsp:Transcript_9636/g.19983  ORF Transcript_9636/g.19983 Transcript_9636/m.19983 type:complete len:464 (-) Transcript_9636:544-1935(-)|eukprot:CAMPEP_0118929240 /NCGR_PEP_ID=MMETSP1169-20130426/6290_1 /TAXON_ID=36882 /ORGANISM="Pyramimonas obovata, Strain CCMP722" /LENGTH=463 /DNA_ID=CAMNT_0006871391 /DNA_START=200 /DNA_END=1591 /DNA_ORIENTATION=-
MGSQAPAGKYEPFGSGVALGDPSWYQSLNTPYYTPSHVAWRSKVREFMDKEVQPIITDWDKQAVQNNHEVCKKYLKDLYRKSAAIGLLPACVGKPWPGKYTPHQAPEGYDYFHELINCDEGTRAGGGMAWAMMGGLGIGLPPVINFGMPKNQALADRCIRECLAGEKIICLCITEPGAGSDVANIQCTAKDMGDHYIVDGNKKWITNGIYADYFTVAVRTGPPGSAHKGISMLLLERSMPGIDCKKMECMGVWPSGTTYIEFDSVKVPKSNLIGWENQGFKQVMYNFNHERWMLAVQAARMARTCVEESLSFARSRRTFGKTLIEHQVIQHKITDMARQCEGLWHWLENITFQMNTMSREEQNLKLGGHIALLKVQSSKTAEFCATTALQVFGGAGYTRNGKGEKVERIYREVKAFAIPGGSEEIMNNLACGQFGFVQKPTPDPRDKKIKALMAELKQLKAKL